MSACTWPQIIDRIIDFARFQIVHSVFTAYDSGYRQIHKGSTGAGDEGYVCFICKSVFFYLQFRRL